MAGDARPKRKVIASCIYCSNPPDGQEHWLNRSLGSFKGNTLLVGRLCTPCNVKFGGTIDLELARTGPTGVTRQVLGIGGRPGHEKKNTFEYKASEIEPPVQIFRVESGGFKPVLQDAIGRNPDGTMIGMQGRVLVIATPEGEQEMRFPRGWGEQHLRSAAEARGLIGGRPVSAHVPPPETLDEFVATSRDIIRAVFGPFELNLYTSDREGLSGPVEPIVMRFNLSLEFLRAVAKVAFHYFLWICPEIGGDESEFSGIKAFVRDGVGETSDFIYKTDSLVERMPATQGPGNDVHVFAGQCLGADIVVQVHFFSQPVGLAFQTFIVKLGRRPETLPSDWRRAHAAVYVAGIEGHDGILKEVSAQ